MSVTNNTKSKAEASYKAQSRTQCPRRRFRMYIWKKWKKSKMKVTNLRKLGTPADNEEIPDWATGVLPEGRY